MPIAPFVHFWWFRKLAFLKKEFFFMVPYYYFDTSYVLIILPVLLFALWAQAGVRSAYSRYSKVRGARGYTGAQVARQILDQNGLYHIRVERVAGSLSDHYDPKSQVVRLSEGVYDSASISAVGIAAHECGHAVQHAQGYAPLKLRSAVIPVTNIGSQLAIPILLVGFLLNSYPLMLLGVFGYALMALFQLITLPVEFNASSRAMEVIAGSHILDEDEQRGAKKVLRAAAMTYVAALASALAQLLRLLLMVGGRRNSRR